MAPANSDNLGGVPPGESPVVPLWKRLASMDQHSLGFIPLLSSLTSEKNRSSTINLCEADAKATLNFMDQASFAVFVRAHNLRCTICSAF